MNYEQLYEGKQDNYYDHSRAEILPFVPLTVRTALDVGCSNGAFGASLKSQRDCKLWGIEPNKQAALEAEKKIDKVINGLFVKGMPELAGQKFDAVFFNDVLEHLAAPEDAVNYCRDLLNPGGYIIASIPNIRWYPVMLSLLRYKDFKYEDAGVMDKTHMRFFTLKSMRRLFESNDYQIIKAEGINKHSHFTFFNILNFLLFKSQEDMKYPQFVIVACLSDARKN